MNLLLLQPDDFADSLTHTRSGQRTMPGHVGERVEGQATVEGERLLHLRKVLQAKVGDTLKAGLLNGPVGEATVLSIDRSVAHVQVKLTRAPPPPLDVHLLLALPRPKFLGRVLQHATTIGVKQIVLLQSARVQKSYWSSNLLDPSALHRHLCLGLEQGRDTLLPHISLLRAFDDLVAYVSNDSQNTRDLLLADGNAARPFPRRASGPASLIIGPEGGFLEPEVRTLVSVGAQPCSLGPRPMRVEAAVSACLGRLLPDPRPAGDRLTRDTLST